MVLTLMAIAIVYPSVSMEHDKFGSVDALGGVSTPDLNQDEARVRDAFCGCY